MRIFYLDRATPCKKFDDFSILEKATEIKGDLNLECEKGEYFTVPLLLVSENETEYVSVCTDNGLVTCLNTQGTDKYGNKFTKSIEISKSLIQPVYICFDTLCSADKTLSAVITVKGDNEYKIPLSVTQVGDKNIKNQGFDDLWRLSRLKWLNSDAFRDNSCTKPYIPVSGNAETVSLLGRRLYFGNDCQLQNAESFFDESVLLCETPQKSLLSKPFAFDVYGENFVYGKPVYIQKGDNAIITNSGESQNLLLNVTCEIFYEGMLRYSVKLTAKNDCSFENISLSETFANESSLYSNGLGKWGGKFEDITHKWNKWHQDCMFISSVNCGARVKFKAENYVRPLTNIYYENKSMVIPQTTWANNDNGVIKCMRTAQGAFLCAETGAYSLNKGESRSFDYEIHVTPFTPVDYKKHYATRYMHRGLAGRSVEDIINEAKESKSNYIIVHHGSEYHPYINYPFIANNYLKPLVDAAHKEGIGVKVYYTLREHGTKMAELFAYKSLGDEIIFYKENGVYCKWPEGKDTWLAEYLGEACIPAWRVLYKKGPFAGEHDISFLVNPDTRLDNYYVEGLKWLIDEIHIDGIYVDDTALDRATFERARKAIDTKTGLPGLIDMHMCNHENDGQGNASCANMYTDIFPFIDDLWIGEFYYYDKMTPEGIMCEVAGLPYGKAGSMLHDGGNLWIGMIFAMSTRRYSEESLPVSNAIYCIWDSFGIQDSTLLGFWHSKNPFATDVENVVVSAYVKDNEALVCVCNFTDEEHNINIKCDTQLLGYTPSCVEKLKIENFQEYGVIDLSEKQTVKPRQGIIFRAKK